MNKDINIQGVVLKTPRLVLRAFEYSDLNDLYEYAKVDGVGEMAGWSHHTSIDFSREILAKFINGKITFAICIEGKVVGSIGIEKYNEDLLTEVNDLLGRELGFVLSKDYWGMGITAEACLAVIDYLFNIEGLDFIACSHFKSNLQSKRVQEKLGFKFLKDFKYETRYNTIEESQYNILYNPNKYNL